MGALVPTFGQNLGLIRKWFAIQDRRLHHRVSPQIFLKDEPLLQKFYILKKWALFRAFFRSLYQNHPIWSRWQLLVFQGRRIWILLDNWVRTIFEGSVPPFCTEHGNLAIQARRFHHRVSHPNCSKGWCPFVKILRSSKISENAFTKGLFLSFY